MEEEGQKSSTWLVKFDSPLLALHMADLQMLAVSLLVHSWGDFMDSLEASTGDLTLQHSPIRAVM